MAKLVSVLSKSRWNCLQVFVIVVPLDSPGKGIDDVRAVLGQEFTPWWEDCWRQKIAVTPEMSKGRIALGLLESHRDTLEALVKDGVGKDQVFQGLAKLSAGMGDDLLQTEILDFAESLGFPKRAFSRAVTKARNAHSNTAFAHLEGNGVKIDLDQPAGIWTKTVLENLRGEVYLSPEGRLARLVDGKLVLFEPFGDGLDLAVDDGPVGDGGFEGEELAVEDLRALALPFGGAGEAHGARVTGHGSGG